MAPPEPASGLAAFGARARQQASSTELDSAKIQTNQAGSDTGAGVGASIGSCNYDPPV